MSVIPSKKSDQIAFHQVHAPVFNTNAGVLNLTTEETSEYTARTTAAAAAYDAARAAESAFHAAIEAQDNALEAVNTFASQLIKGIRAYATQTNDPTLYAAAQIPSPKAPSPQPPVTPSNVRFTLNGDGTLRVDWDGVLSHGTAFEVWRTLQDSAGDTAPAERVAVRGEKNYTDDSIPAGTTTASYSIKAVKGKTTTPGSTPAVARFIPGSGVTAVRLAS